MKTRVILFAGAVGALVSGCIPPPPGYQGPYDPQPNQSAVTPEPQPNPPPPAPLIPPLPLLPLGPHP